MFVELTPIEFSNGLLARRLSMIGSPQTTERRRLIRIKALDHAVR